MRTSLANTTGSPEATHRRVMARNLAFIEEQYGNWNPRSSLVLRWARLPRAKVAHWTLACCVILNLIGWRWVAFGCLVLAALDLGFGPQLRMRVATKRCHA
ncbi:MAG: hypothetical protein GY715_03945 [Planctomycetes bacterium]|nr:hypothetical protein [Planctomycetota bacterium]